MPIRGKAHDIISPIHCPHCGKLAFFYKIGSNPNKVGLLDSFDPSWKAHPCSTSQGDEFWKHASLEPVLQLSGDVSVLPFDIKKMKYETQKKRYYFGVVLETCFYEGKGHSLIILTDDGDLLSASLSEENVGEVAAGMLLKLSSLTSVQKSGFRLKKIELISVPVHRIKKTKGGTEYYQLQISGRDLEKLEACIDQVLQILKQENMMPLAIIPRRNEKKENEVVYHREMTFFSEGSSALLTLQKAHLPEDIHLSVHQERLE